MGFPSFPAIPALLLACSVLLVAGQAGKKPSIAIVDEKARHTQ